MLILIKFEILSKNISLGIIGKRFISKREHQ